ncbi:MAG: CBS domain-containing protein [Nitrospirales bacterium]|nr:magnesium transporter [Nitrospira sp.]MDR4502187.1 CBS domain-containing protein [Nitrospirales bacterium]
MGLQQDLTNAYIQKHPMEAARFLESHPPAISSRFLKELQIETISSVLEHYLPGNMSEVLKHFSPEISGRLISRLSTTAARAVLRQFDDSVRSTLLSHIDSTLASYLRRTLTHPDFTAGSLADPRVLTLPPDLTVEQALKRIGQECQQAIYYLYITDHDTTLHGVVLMKELLAANADKPLQFVMNEDVKKIPASANAQDLLNHPAWQLYDSLPVVEQEKSFIGVLRHRALKKFLEGRHDEPEPHFLSDALLQLWEAYALSGIGLMTTMGDILKAAQHEKPTRGQEETLR